MSRDARSVALDILLKIEQDQAFSNLQLHQTLVRSRLEKQDAALVTELVYGTLQRQNTIDYFLEKYVAKGMQKLEPWVRQLLRLSFYQIFYLDRIPHHAAVNEAVNIAKKRGHRGISGMVNGVLRNVIRNLDSLKIPDTLPPAKRIALQHSHPEWLVRRWIGQFGEEETEMMCEENNKAPDVSLRVNRMKKDREAMISELQSNGYDAIPSLLSDDGIVIRSRSGNLANTKWYEQGELSIQDESSMVVASVLDAGPGMKVLDCCAAPGGKTTHIAETMDDRGELWANDIHEHKQALIDAQVKRLGLTCVKTIVGDATRLQDRFPSGSFDRILLDAPCSGLGVIRRKPDIKWRKTEKELAELPDLQYELLVEAAGLVKPGGVLVYSTCTLNHEENERVIERFLSEHRVFEADHRIVEFVPQALRPSVDEQRGHIVILPHHYGSDGFYIARLVRNNEE